MNRPSATPIDGLRREHTRMRSILTLIEHQLAQLETEGKADFVLLANALYYMRKFPSQVHHPKEDAIFERLRLADPAYGKEVARVLEQHAQIYEVEEWLIDLALQRPLPQSAECKRIIEFGRDYLRLQREHCRTEETSLFQRAIEVLTKKDWAAVAGLIRDVEDPLFGKHRQERFQTLYDYILRESEGT